MLWKDLTLGGFFMSIQNLINLIDSNMFLLVSYALIFILISSAALKFLAKVFMFFIYIGVFIFGMSFMLSTSSDSGIASISIDKIAKNMSKTFKDLKEAFNTSKTFITDLEKTIDVNKAKDYMSDINDTLDKASK